MDAAGHPSSAAIVCTAVWTVIGVTDVVKIVVVQTPDRSNPANPFK
jgi:hypothetical protein